MKSSSTRLGRILMRVGEFLVGRVMLGALMLIVLFAVAYGLRVPILRATGDMLIVEDPKVPCDAVYVLGGSPLERGTLGGELLMEGLSPVAYCTGSMIPSTLLTVGLTHTEADLSRIAAMDAGADSTRVIAVHEGTSTFEEAEMIIAHAQRLGYDNIGIITTEFHSRRVGRVFRKRAKGTALKVHVFTASSLRYDSERWWESEEGLLMVNNEYTKLLYYMLKH